MSKQPVWMGDRYYRVRDYHPDEGDQIMEDGEYLRVPMEFRDSAQQDVMRHFGRRRAVDDALIRHNSCAGHRPGFVLDALIHAAQPTVTVDAVSDDLERRRGTALADAMLDRQKALAEIDQRQQWRTNDSLEQIGSGEYGRGGDHEYEPDEDDNGDGDDGDDDSLEALQARREAAYQESAVRSSNAWRTAGPANANQRQLERWRGK